MAKFDPIAWAKKQPVVRTGRPCSICVRREAAAAVAKLVAAIDSGEVQCTVKQMIPMLAEHYGLNVTPAIVWNHVREHVRKGANRGA